MDDTTYTAEDHDRADAKTTEKVAKIAHFTLFKVVKVENFHFT